MKPVVFQKETKLYEIPMSLFFTILLMLFSNTNNEISRIEGLIFLVLFCFFLGYTIYMGKMESQNELIEVNTPKNKNNSLIKNILMWVKKL